MENSKISIMPAQKAGIETRSSSSSAAIASSEAPTPSSIRAGLPEEMWFMQNTMSTMPSSTGIIISRRFPMYLTTISASLIAI